MAVHFGSSYLSDPLQAVGIPQGSGAADVLGNEGLDLLVVVAFAASAISTRTGPCDCGVSVVTSRGVPDTLAATSDVAPRFDWLQHKLGQGPGVDPVQQDGVLYSPDLAMDGRWPELGPVCAAEVGVRSLMRVDIPVVGGARAAMSFFSAEPAAFDAGQMVRAVRFARFATKSVQHDVQNRDSADQEAAGGSNRLANALGLVMGRYQMSSEQAFEMLRDSAEILHIGILDLATEVILSGRLPAKAIGNARRDRRALKSDGRH